MLKKWILLFLQCKIEILQFFSAKKKRGSRSLSWCGECLIPERTADGMVSTASCIRNVSVLEHSWTVQCSITCSPLNSEGNRLKVVFLHLRKVSHTTQIFSCASFCLSFAGWIFHSLTEGTFVTIFNVLHSQVHKVTPLHNMHHNQLQLPLPPKTYRIINLPHSNLMNSVGSHHGCHLDTDGHSQQLRSSQSIS